MNTRNTTHGLLVALLCALSVGCVETTEEDGATSSQQLDDCPAGQMGYKGTCVPMQCHGRTTRSSDFTECVVDASKPEIQLDVLSVTVPTPTSGRSPLPDDNSAALSFLDSPNKSPFIDGIIFPGMEYEWGFDVLIRNIDAFNIDKEFAPLVEPSEETSFDTQFDELAPPAARKLTFKLWLENQYSYKAPGDDRWQDVTGFRCVATGIDFVPADYPDVVGDDRTYRIRFTSALSSDCADDGVLHALQNAASKVGLVDDEGANDSPDDDKLTAVQKFNENALSGPAKLRVAFDIEGNTVLHFGEQGQTPQTSTPECEPNPIELMVNETTGRQQPGKFYSQRTNSSTATKTLNVADPVIGRTAYIAPKSIRARQDLTLRPFTNVESVLTIDYEYDLDNFNRSHAFNPFNPTAKFRENPDEEAPVVAGAAWGGVTPPSGVSYRNNLYTANYAPTNLKAEFFLVPTDVDFGTVDSTPQSTELKKYRIGSRQLTKDDENTLVSDTYNVPIAGALKKKFVDPESKLYIAGDTRTFTLAYCVTSSIESFSAFTSTGFNDRTVKLNMREVIWQLWSNYEDTPFREVPNDAAAWDELVLDQSLDQLKAEHDEAARQRAQGLSTYDPGMYLPFLGPESVPSSFRYGCRRDPRPINISVDRFVTTTDPIKRTGYQGTIDAKSTGDEASSGSNDNEHDIQCEDGDQNDCDEQTKVGGRSDGADTRSLYSVRANSARGKNASGNDEASASVQGEFMGFAIIDQADEGSNACQSSTIDSIVEQEDDECESGVSDLIEGKISFNIQPNWGNIAEKIASKANIDTPVFKSEWKKGFGGEPSGLGYALGFKIPFQIGPVPVEVVIAFSVGANLSLDIALQWKAGDDAYPCLGDGADCPVYSSGTATFDDANKVCRDKGGRLLEMSTQTEYDSISNLTGEFWVGGQTAYRISDPKCADDDLETCSDDGSAGCTNDNTTECTNDDSAECEGLKTASCTNDDSNFCNNDDSDACNNDTTFTCSNDDSNACKKAQDTEIRWLSSSEPIAVAKGLNSAFDTTGWQDQVSGPGINFTGQHYPTPKGMVYNPTTEELTLADKTEIKNYVCHYERAESESYFKRSFTPEVKVAAGVELSGCVTRFCLIGDVAFIQFTLRPEFSTVSRTLTRTEGGTTQTSDRETVGREIKFAITLFPATFSASLDLWLVTISWAIATYNGIKLPEQLLDSKTDTSIGEWK